MKKLILLAIVMIIFCAVYIIAKGDVYYAKHSYYADIQDPDSYHLRIDEGNEYISVDDFRIEDNTAKFTVHALSEGKAEVSVYRENDDSYAVMIFYVHKFGLITEASLFGNCNGGNIIIIMMTIYFAVILGVFIRKYLDGIKKDYYSYHNITLLGVIIFVSMIILSNALFAFNRNGLLDFIRGIMNAAGLTLFLIPVAMLITLGILVSNLVLIVKEGANKKNILGTVFSFAYLVFLIFPFAFEGFLQLQTIIDVHKETGFGHYLDIIVTNFCYSVTAYMTVILIATIIMGIRAAHRIPEFDKDFILILGCRIRKDGQVTPLLKGRADAAVRFANMQKKATGKDVYFVPSGGQGKDEVISEAEAVKNYLISRNIDEKRIICEDRSLNTAENFKFSLQKIREMTAQQDQGKVLSDGRKQESELTDERKQESELTDDRKQESKDSSMNGAEGPKIAFATSGYHVFRSGYIASEQGIRAEGIGAGTKAYFWINAFIRELIATLYYEKKKHLMVVAALLIAITVMGSILFLSVLY